MEITYSKYSSITGNERETLEAQIVSARANYQKLVDEYNWGMSDGHPSYAKRVRKPRMDTALEILNNLLAQRDQLNESTGVEQNIDIIKQITNDTTGENAESGLPWVTIGLAVGALVVIVVIIKVL